MKLVYVFMLVAIVALAQEQRIVTETADPTWSTVSCNRNADASIECVVCVTVTATVESRLECASSKLKSTVNINRAQNLGDSLRNRALKKFNVDGGEP